MRWSRVPWYYNGAGLVKVELSVELRTGMGNKPACIPKRFCLTVSTKLMRAKQFILLSMLFTFAAISACCVIARHRTKVFGHLSGQDLVEISRVIHKDLRRYELPTLSKENLHNPRYVLVSVKQYVGRRILWVDVRDERTVRAFVGDSKAAIPSDGWSYTLHKDLGWRIGGTAYWGSAE